MTSIPLNIEQNYVSVDTDEWWDAVGEYSDALTESLRAWLSYHDGDIESYYSGQAHPHTEYVARWAGVTFRADDHTRNRTECDWWDMCTGLYGEGEPWEMCTVNEGNTLLDRNVGAVWFHAPDGALIIVETTDRFGCYIDPIVRRVKVSDESLTEYNRASGECHNGHEWATEDGGVRMYADGSYSHGVRISEHIRPIPAGHYLACPECGTDVQLSINLW